MAVELRCVMCGKAFAATRADARACSQACRTRLSRSRRAAASAGGAGQQGTEGEVEAERPPMGPATDEPAARPGAIACEGAPATPAGPVSAAPTVVPPQAGQVSAAPTVVPPQAAPASAAPTVVPPQAAATTTSTPDPGPADAPPPATTAALLRAHLAEVLAKQAAAPEPRRAPAGQPPTAHVALTDPRYAPFADALREVAAANDARKTAEERRLAAIGGVLITSALPEDLAPFGKVIDPVIAQGLGPARPRRTGAPAAPWERTPTRAELDDALARLSDRPTWERALAAGDPAIARLVVALAALARGGPERPDHTGPENPFLAGILALGRLAAADPKLQAGIDRAEGAALIGVRVALRIRVQAVLTLALAEATGKREELDAMAGAAARAAEQARGARGESGGGDAVVEGGAGSGEVAALRAEVEGLRAEVEGLRRRVDALVRRLARVGEV